jgi:putative Mn2+ efflux pump MntP
MGIASVLIGVVGLIVITYFFYQAEESHEEVGEMQHIVTHYTMPLAIRVSLFSLEAMGIILGYFAFRNGHVKLGLLGLGLCALCLIMLYGYTF